MGHMAAVIAGTVEHVAQGVFRHGLLAAAAIRERIATFASDLPKH